MQKILAMLLAAIVAISLCACTTPPQSDPATPSERRTESQSQTSGAPDTPVEQPTEIEATELHVPESLYLKYVDYAPHFLESDDLKFLSSDYTITREPDESAHQETIIIDVIQNYEYFSITREARIIYQYYSSDDIWEAINLDSDQSPDWTTVSEEVRWDKMLGTWTHESFIIQYTINIEDIDTENRTVTFSYDIVDTYLSTLYFNGSKTVDLDSNNEATFRLEDSEGGSYEFYLILGRHGVALGRT